MMIVTDQRTIPARFPSYFDMWSLSLSDVLNKPPKGYAFTRHQETISFVSSHLQGMGAAWEAERL
jgi:hypothetical protein